MILARFHIYAKNVTTGEYEHVKCVRYPLGTKVDVIRKAQAAAINRLADSVEVVPASN